ncbi:hypothetical protein GF378_02500 [Candidatus Pacearchaeota archaeon]|nr:hypothetical protein [Candidatus Pacearchaeota archaeon]
MPNGDRTGPNGQGPMTGRAMGFCAGYNSPGFTKGVPRCGRGMGRGFGRGFGFRRRAFANPTQAQGAMQAQTVQPVQPVVVSENQEKEILEQDLEDLKAEMQDIQERLKGLKSE